jgi:hypothetical protein
MSDEANNSIAREQASAMKATADENVKELREELEIADDEVVVPTFKPECSSAGSKLNSNDNSQKEPSEMNIRPQR